MDTDIAFIGIGQMGFGMARNVRQKMAKTRTLIVCDVSAEACTRFIEVTRDLGHVEVVATAREAASRAPTLISIIPGPEHVRQVYLDKDNGVLAADRDATRLMLECSTIDPETTREVGKAVMDAGLGQYVDTPVSGGIRGAASGSLAIMAGCTETDPQARRIRETLSMMGASEKVFLCGSLGTGLAVKISNNYISGTVLLAVAEAMAIGVRAGVDKKVLYKVLRNGSGQTWMGDHMQPVPGVLENSPSSNGYNVGFRHELMVKDMSLGIQAGRKTGIEPSMALTAVEAYKKAAEEPDCKGKDASSVYLLITREK